MDLNIEISPSEKKIVEIIGKDKWSELRKKTINSQPNKCACCNYPEPEVGFSRINLNPKLNVHVLPYDSNIDLVKDYDDLNTIILCDACHTIKHFYLSGNFHYFPGSPSPILLERLKLLYLRAHFFHHLK